MANLKPKKENNTLISETFSLVETENTLEATKTERLKGVIRRESYKIFFEEKPLTSDPQNEFFKLKTSWQKS
jgi:hypothetical protein